MQNRRGAGEQECPDVTSAKGVGAAVGNYDVTYGAGDFTITKKTATVTAGGGTKIYGAVDPSFSTTQVGFTAADAGTITLRTTRGAGESVGASVPKAEAVGEAHTDYAMTSGVGDFPHTKMTA